MQVMTVQEQNEGGGSSTSFTADNCMSSVGARSGLVAQLSEICSYGTKQTVKVRKPYTITKQREKWTAEEHRKFLEALKLYGRGWRQIEEHVGTKTAVQIRSHAQKFFSKVGRDSNGSTEISMNPIEIPPPRPKRKPLHPYPRKSVDSVKDISISNQPERSQSPNLSTAEKDSQSPMSVLSAFGSDELGSPVSEEQRNTCPSTTSCTTNGYLSIPSSPIQKQSKSGIPHSSGGVEKGSLSTLKIYTNLTLDNLSFVKYESEVSDIVCRRNDTITDSPVTSIKLFGRTVMVINSETPVAEGGKSSKSQMSKIGYDDLGFTNERCSQALSSSSDLSLRIGEANPSSLGFQLDAAIKQDSAPRPPWSLHQDLQYVNIASFEGSSFIDPVVGSFSDMDNVKKTNSERPESYTPKPSRVFVPYKRCLAQRDAGISLIISEENDRQRARVCL